ncbi:DUF6309 family protein [Streptomyces sp. x-80]|uniref:DUF6309 family protein n=1 Tax=Streptomyces sp. x-80 TaxID=2789282 RepID=UPI00397FDF4E
MRVLGAVPFEAVLRHFTQEHPFDPADQANTNDEAENHVRDAQLEFHGRWHRVLLDGPEVQGVVLPWHLGEDGEVELIPNTGLTVNAAADRLATLGTSYTRSNPLCARKLTWQRTAPRRPVFLSTRALPGRDYDALAVREGLIHLDGLHRMLAWAQAGQLVSGSWFEAYAAGLSPAHAPHDTGHDQDGPDVPPEQRTDRAPHHADDMPHIHGGLGPS